MLYNDFRVFNTCLASCDTKKLLDLGIFLFNTFGESSDYSMLKTVESNVSFNKMVLITENYEHVMSYFSKNQVLQMIESKQFSATKIFRQLVKLVIPDDDVWAKNNNISMQEKYP